MNEILVHTGDAGLQQLREAMSTESSGYLIRNSDFVINRQYLQPSEVMERYSVTIPIAEMGQFIDYTRTEGLMDANGDPVNAQAILNMYSTTGMVFSTSRRYGRTIGRSIVDFPANMSSEEKSLYKQLMFESNKILYPSKYDDRIESTELFPELSSI